MITCHNNLFIMSGKSIKPELKLVASVIRSQLLGQWEVDTDELAFVLRGR